MNVTRPSGARRGSAASRRRAAARRSASPGRGSARPTAARRAARRPPSPRPAATGSRCSSATASSTSSVWSCTSAWWNGLCSIPRNAAQLGQDDVREPVRRHQLQPAADRVGRHDPLELGEHPLGRDARDPVRVRRGRRARSRRRSPGPTRRRSAPRAGCAAGRRPAPARTPSARPVARGPPARHAGRASSPPPSGSAIALIVKSRWARSARMSSSRSVTRSTCHA